MESFGRKIDYARVSVTDLCNLRCRYCMPEEGVAKLEHCQMLTLEELLTICRALVKAGITKLRVTGGEPLVRKNVAFFLRELGKLGLESLSLTTNGILLPSYIDDIKAAGIITVNVSLDTLDAQKYAEITRGGELSQAIKGIDAALNAGLGIKLNAVLLKDFNDGDLAKFLEFSNTRGAFFRFIELMPFSGEEAFFERYSESIDSLNVRYPDIVDKHVLQNTQRLYEYEGVEFGVITPLSHRFCESCNRIRITAKGELLPCLHHTEKIELAPFLNDEESLLSAIRDGVGRKPLCHDIANGVLQNKNMNKIGG